MADELPKQDRLAKLLRMTASPNDGEALTAIRMANALLTSAGWDWDKLLSGKITVVADPFAAAPMPKQPQREEYHAPPPRPQPPPQKPSFSFHPASSRPAAPPPPPPQPRPARSSKKNIYPGYCYCCGNRVEADAGFTFNPRAHAPRAKDGYTAICPKCNTSNAFVGNSPAKRNTYVDLGPTPNLNRL